MAKYLVVILPLIIGLAINSASGTNYFEPISLVIGTLIYPLTTLVVQVYFVRIRDKDKKHD
jgi:SNF family Na+-dependent transporter